MVDRECLDNAQVFFAVALYFIAFVTSVLSVFFHPPGILVGLFLAAYTHHYERISSLEKEVEKGGRSEQG